MGVAMIQQHTLEVEGVTLAEMVAEVNREFNFYFGETSWTVHQFLARAVNHQLRTQSGQRIGPQVDHWVATVEAVAVNLEIRNG